VEEGILPGGGTAFVRCEKPLQDLLGSSKMDGDRALGVRVLLDALSVPVRTLADNAGFEGHVVLRKVRKAGATQGFDCTDGEVKDMYEAGIVDPTKVSRSALQNAASVAALLLSTDALVANLPEPEKDEGPGGGEGMDEDY
jgi:chaperonin GroEL